MKQDTRKPIKRNQASTNKLNKTNRKKQIQKEQTRPNIQQTIRTNKKNKKNTQRKQAHMQGERRIKNEQVKQTQTNTSRNTHN